MASCVKLRGRGGILGTWKWHQNLRMKIIPFIFLTTQGMLLFKYFNFLLMISNDLFSRIFWCYVVSTNLTFLSQRKPFFLFNLIVHRKTRITWEFILILDLFSQSFLFIRDFIILTSYFTLTITLSIFLHITNKIN